MNPGKNSNATPSCSARGSRSFARPRTFSARFNRNINNTQNREQNHGRCYDECDDETRQRNVCGWKKSAGKNGEVELRDRRGVVLQGKRKGKKK